MGFANNVVPISVLQERGEKERILDKLPEPECYFGYTSAQVKSIMETEERRKTFYKWMSGQTMSLCDGRLYNHDEEKYEKSKYCDRPHGPVIYSHDLKRFLRGLPIID